MSFSLLVTNKFRVIAVVLLVFFSLVIYEVVIASDSTQPSLSISRLEFAYVVNNQENTISQYKVGSDGKLNAISISTIRALKRPVQIVLSPKKQFAYVISYDSSQGDGTKISQYRIDSSGKLIAPADNDLTIDLPLYTLAISLNERFAYATSPLRNIILQFEIGRNGTLSPNSTQKTHNGPLSIAFSPSRKFIYLANSGDNIISQYQIASNGKLLPLPQRDLSAGTSPHYIAVSPATSLVFVVNDFQDIFTYRAKSNSSLIPLSKYSLSDKSYAPGGVAVSPNGCFLYVINRKLQTILQFQVSSDGKLLPLDNVSIKAGMTPTQITISSNGKFAYVVNASDNTISQFQITSNGNLQPLSPAVVETGKSPSSMALIQN